MKKILMFLLVLFGFIFVPEVKAQDYKLKKYDQEGIYFVRTGGSVPDKNGTFAIYYLGDYLAYCIDPSKSIRTEDYVSSDGYVNLPYSSETLEKLKLYGYYGREYPGHDNVRYSMAAQSLIWEAAGGQKVTFWTGKNGTGKEIDVTSEKNEIKALAERHHIIPQLPYDVYTDVLHETIIEDKNNVLDNFEVMPDSRFDAYIKNNKLYVTPKQKGTFIIQLQRKSYDDTNTVIFVGKNNTDTQTLGRLRFSDLSTQEIVLDVDGAHLFIQKVDEFGNPIKINAINFKIKNLSTGDYLCDRYDCVFETNENGIVVTNGVDFGDYEIEELEDQIIKGYTWNSEKKVISVTEDNIKWNKDRHAYVDNTFENNSVTVSLEIFKKGEIANYKDNNIIYQEISLGNITFDLYDSDNNLIRTITTDNNGYVKVDNLKVGKYYLKENNSDTNYISNKDKISFEIKQENQYQEHVNYQITVNNYLKKGKLEFSKIDSKTSEPISDTVIEIYNDKNELLMTKETDENGEVIIDNMPIGKYYIKEKKANYNYQKTNEIVEFEITDNNQVIKKSMVNNRIVGTLNVTKYGEVFNTIDDEIVREKTVLKDIEFNLYDEKDKLIETLKTNENGVIEKELPLGKYYLIEKTVLPLYKENKNKYYFEIKKKGDYGIDVNLEINNELKKGGIELFKKGEDYKFVNNEIIYEKTELANIKFEIYSENDIFYKTIKTNDDGYVKYMDLPLGKYYLIEKSVSNNYIKDEEKHFFEINDDGKVVKIEIDNYLKKGSMEFSKVDLKTNDGIPNTVIEIYNNRNELLLTRETDDLGKVKIENLPVGKYYIIEKEANILYQITNEKVFFEIKEDGDVIETKMTNEKINISVPKTNTKEDVIAHSIVGICLFIGIGGLFCERKKVI